MFEWIVGSRLQQAIEDLEPDPACDTTFVEPPDTPAPQFAMKAFKQALWGTPAPADPKSTKKPEKAADPRKAKPDLLAPQNAAPASSPSKQSKSILMTPGTTSKGKKTVSFGSQVLDNEGKRGATGRSGIPDDCPGKFPSPWTPGTELKEGIASDKKPRTSLTAALYNARTTTPKSVKKLKTRDDSDITLDMSAPRSESGKYWKEQYESYAALSEKQTKQLVAKQQMAKKFAQKKDSEAMEAVSRLAEERKRHRSQLQQLEAQNKDLQERLRVAMASETSASIEAAALRSRVDALEKSLVVSSTELLNSKLPFNVLEDGDKDSSLLKAQKPTADARSRTQTEMPAVILANPVKPARALEDKENSPPKQDRTRSQTQPNTPSQFSSSHRLSSTKKAEAPSISKPASQVPSPAPPPSYVPLNTLRSPDAKTSSTPLKPSAALASSPLPQGSPDPWMQVEQDSFDHLDRMALPLASGTTTTTQPTKPQTRHRVSRSLSHAATAATKRLSRTSSTRADKSNLVDRVDSHQVHDRETANIKQAPKHTTDKLRMLVSETQLDTSDQSVQHAEPHSRLAEDKKALPLDRKQLARQRLEERKRRKGV